MATRQGSLEESQLVLVVADQHILGLAIMRQHHLVGLAAESGLLVAAEGGVGGVGMVAVHPDTSSLDSAGHLVK